MRKNILATITIIWVLFVYMIIIREIHNMCVILLKI